MVVYRDFQIIVADYDSVWTFAFIDEAWTSKGELWIEKLRSQFPYHPIHRHP